MEGFLHLKKSDKSLMVLLSAFTCVLVLTLSSIQVFAAGSDTQIYHFQRADYDFHLYMTHQTSLPASGNLQNGTTPLYNLYTVPFEFGLTRTNIDGSVPADSGSYYIYGWVWKSITITFDKNCSPELLEIQSADNASLYVETISWDSGNKKLTLSVFWEYDNFAVNRSQDFGSFTLLCRYNTSALSDTLSVTSVTSDGYTANLNATTTPASQGSMVETIVRAINNAGDLDTALNLLTSIKSNTDLYSQVLAALGTISTDVADIKAYLLSGNAGATLDDVAASQSAALSDYLDVEASLNADDPAGPPQAIALGEHVDNFTDTIEQSLYFWSYELREFFDDIGMIWILLVVGLVIGLTGFLLRLRR